MDETIKKFIRFLKLRKIYMKYVNEVKRAGLKKIDSTLSLCDSGPEDFVLYAFYWDRTEDGSDFWANIDVEWNKYLKENK